MRAAGRHTAPPGDPQAGLTAASRPGFHLAGPATAARHATSLTLQTRQPPSARHAALLHTGPTAAARRRRSPCEADGCFTAPPPLHNQKGQKGAIGRARSRIRQGCGWQGPQPESRRVTGHSRKSPQLAGVAEGRGAIGRPAAVSGMGLRRVWRSFFAGFVPFASLNIRFERVQTASQPYFCSRKRFTP